MLWRTQGGSMNTQRFAPSVSGIGRPTTLRRVASLLGALFLAVVLIWSWTGTTSSAFAVGPYEINQCNYADDTTLGAAIECSVVVTNDYNVATDSGTSTVTVKECHGAAGAQLTCTTSTTRGGPVVTSVNQCNNSVNAPGSTVTCSAVVTNNITGTFTTTPATVNQCDGSGAGGGALPLACNPTQTTTNATVTQCNGSLNGGGGTQRVQCTVDSTSTVNSALSVTVNQCNDSANGGGSLGICSASLQNVAALVVVPSTPPSTTPSTTPSTPPTTTPSTTPSTSPTVTPGTPGTTPSGTPSTPSGTPSTPSTTPGGGGGEGGGTPTTPAVPVVPGTPSGSASPSTPGVLAETGTNDAGGLLIGALSLLFAGALGVLAVNVHRHRRSLSNNAER
jgi:hypothetical protein